MSYKTILVHIDHGANAEERMRHAARLALAFGAHLIGSAFADGRRRHHGDGVGVSVVQRPAPLDAATLARHNANALARFEAIAASEGVSSVERRLMDDDTAAGMALQARYADLVVVGQTDPNEPASAELIGGLPEQVVLDGGRPVLIIPHGPRIALIGSKVLLAWDGSLEATRTVFNALPLLRRATMVTVTVFTRPGAGRDPGADLGLYLARHGVSCEVRVDATPLRSGESLLEFAKYLKADLLVMGGYGHARFREIMLGGVTETVLGDMNLPVLMSH